jgi:hypothetical protein
MGGGGGGGGGALAVLEVTSVEADVHSFDELATESSRSRSRSRRRPMPMPRGVSSTSEHHSSPPSRTERGEGEEGPPTMLSSFAMVITTSEKGKNDKRHQHDEISVTGIS